MAPRFRAIPFRTGATIVAATLMALPHPIRAQTASPAPAPSPAPAAAPAPAAPNYRIQYNGLVDGYALFQFRNPRNASTLTGRVYDVRNDSPALAMAELNVFQNPRPGALGFKATLVTGDATDINHYDFEGASGGRGEARFKNLQQLYGSYAFGTDGAGVDVGKFVTPFGYEQIEATGNNNYSHSIPFGLEPTYQFGARLYSPAHALGISGLIATAYVANAVYNTPSAGVQDDNRQPAYIGQLAYTDPRGRFTATSTLGLAKDKFDFSSFGRSDTNTRVTLNDNAFTYALSGTSGLGLNYVYAKFEPNGGPRQMLSGIGVYYHRALSPKTVFAVRFSGTDTTTEAVGFQPRPYEVTATYQIKPAVDFTTFLEYRHDGTNVANSFLDSASQLTQKSQDTFTVAGVFQF